MDATRAWRNARPGVRAHARWRIQARPSQLAPSDRTWFIWLILAGRGYGKTRAGAEWVAEQARRFPGCRIALTGQTFADVRDTMVEGESGLLSVLELEELRGESIDDSWNRSLGELFLANGSRFKAFSSEKPRQLRGPQHHFAWGDEPATWFDAPKGPAEDTTFSNLIFGCRLTIEGDSGEAMSEPRIMLTGTPKPVALLTKKDEEPKGLLHRDNVVITRGHSDENVANLAETYRAEVIEPLRNTRLGRQELAAELLEDVPGALWKRAWFTDNRVSEPPYGGWQGQPVIGVDTADGLQDGDEQAYTVVAHGMDHYLYVAENEGMRVSVDAFAGACIDVAVAHHGRIVLEANHGGAFAKKVFDIAMRQRKVFVPLEVVHASQGKRTRAEPVAALYEQGRIRHIGEYPELEDQMTSFTGAPNQKSPDRLDSLVWAVWKFTGYSFGPPLPDHLEQAVPYTDRPDYLKDEDWSPDELAVPWR